MSTNVGEIDLSLILNSDKFSSQLNNIDKQANTASSKISASLSKIGKAAAVAFSVTKIVQFGKECLKVATETSNAWIGLNSILTGQGKSYDQAKKFIQDYISDGLVPLNNAVAAYKNLALRGYSSEQIQKTMNALKNSATFARQSTYTLGEAVQTATEGLKNENSVVVDNAGVTKNVAKMWEDYAKSIGKTTANLTQAEKIQAEVNGILEETKFQSNDAAIYANTYSGKLAQLNTAFTNLKTTIGNVIQPIAKLFIPMVTTATNAVTKLFTALAGLMSLFGLKADSVETVSNGIGDMAVSADNASKAVEGIGDSAAKSAKKIKKSLAGWDEMTKLDDNSDSGSGSGSSGGGGAGDLAGMSEALSVSTALEQDSSAFDSVIEKAKELASIFKEGFDISFGDTNFKGILGHLQGLKQSIIDIWTDSDVIYSAEQWIDTLLYSLGQATGAVARIGVNIAEGLIGSIDNYISQNIDRIKTHICNMFDITSEDMAITGNAYQALGEISDVFKSDTAKQIGADIIAMFANPIMSAREITAKFARDIRGLLFQPIIDNSEKLKKTINNVLKPIQKMTNTLAKAFTYVGDKWNKVYDNSIKPLMDSLKTGLSDTFSKFLDVYNQYVVPMLESLAEGFSTLWEQHLQPFVDNVTGLVSSIITAIQTLWELWLKPLIDWIIANLIPKIVPIIESMWKTIQKVWEGISDTIGGIIKALKGLIDFIVGAFTGDWDKAWNGIKEMFSGIWDAIKGIVETVWASIKGGIETSINIVKGVIESVLSFIKFYWETIWNGIKTFVTTIWNGIKTMLTNVLNGIKTFFTNIWNGIKDFAFKIWDGLLNKIDKIFPGMRDIIETIINAIKRNITETLNKIKETWSNIWNGIKETASTIWNSIKTTVSTIWGNISGTINTVIENIKGFVSRGLENVSTTFSNIFNGIWDIVKGVCNSILGGIESMVNGVIRGLNRMINALNKIQINIPDWVPELGGKKFGFNIPTASEISLPRLAQGAFVKANTPQLAVVGDNKTQGEIISPEGKMREVFLGALKEFSNMMMGSNQEYVPIENNISVFFDSEEIETRREAKKARLVLATNGRRS